MEVRFPIVKLGIYRQQGEEAGVMDQSWRRQNKL